MATYSELNQELWWRREYLPAPMKTFCINIARALAIPVINVGAKGDNAPGHMKGGHRSQAWILNSRHCTNRTYTVWRGLAPFLMDALGAIDITPRDRDQMLLISQRIDRATRAGWIEEVTEWYGNTDNDTRVDGWNNIQNRVASSDSSHLWHLHLGFNRHTLSSDEMFARLFSILTTGNLPQGSTGEMLILAQVQGSPGVWKGDGIQSVGVTTPEAVTHLMAAGAKSLWLSSHYNPNGIPFASDDEMFAVIGAPKEGSK